MTDTPRCEPSALLPCECGREPTILRRTPLVGGIFRAVAARVECTPCELSTQAWHDTDELAIAAWNCRTPPTEVEKLQAERDDWCRRAKDLGTIADTLRTTVAGLVEALEDWLTMSDGFSDYELARRLDPAGVRRVKNSRSALARAKGGGA